MENSATQVVKTEIGDIEVRSLIFDDLETIGELGMSALVELANAEADNPLSIAVGLKKPIIDGLKVILTRCSSATEKQLKTLSIASVFKLIYTWMEVSRWEEIVQLFFVMKSRILEASKNLKQT